MGEITTAAAIMGGIGLFFGVLLAVAYRFLRVAEDPRLSRVVDMLPGTNCGACGEPGCQAFGEGLVSGANQPGQCTVSSPDAIEAIATFLGVDAGAIDKLVARLHCAGGRSRAPQIAHYEGHESCRAAALAGGGGKGCSWGCLGLADCETACTFDAIRMTADGLPRVTPGLCTACGDCVEICPKDLFELLPIRQPLVIQCRTPLSGDEAMALCQVACDACGRCAADAEGGLIQMAGGLPVIDYARVVEADHNPVLRCPTGAIRWVLGRQFDDVREASDVDVG